MQPSPLVIPLLGLLGCSSSEIHFSTTSIPASRSPSNVAIGDLNRDGKPDLAVTSYEDANVSVYLGLGDGTFDAQAKYPTGLGSRELTVADFDGDGWPDMVVQNDIAGTRGFLRNRGDGTFDPTKNQDNRGGWLLQAADFNGDQKAELMVSGASLSIVSPPGVLPAVARDLPIPSEWMSAAFPVPVADFDRDGTLDVAGVGMTVGGRQDLVIAYSVTDAEHVTTRRFVAGNASIFMASSDFNLDGAPDLACAPDCWGDPSCAVAVFLSDGRGGMVKHEVTAISGFIHTITTGDVNGDGIPDLAFIDNTSDQLQVLIGTGDGGFRLNRILGTGNGLRSVALADLNADGKDDIVVTNEKLDSLTVYLVESNP